ncbi:hypothetical protein BDB00DRAFT_380251 [Zychaea mexicana]|uniref:uncharacterized protein n=1 Tax=Zychaea mexicana TaxID=64656 RepID=UPI0022FDDF6E|nr:uncharacterized protein BDB00DRAFT_380251 [Zychaea mexicana]KAI9493227.1 hypothetical protein BDB00DRAFT_380251 [Zychaea mexicana]
MLNPKAIEFKPGQFGTPTTPSQSPEVQETQEKARPPPSQQQQQHSKKRPPKPKHLQQPKHRSKSDRRSSTDQHPPPPSPSKKTSKPKNQQKQQQQAPSPGRRHKASSSAQQQTSSSSSSAQQGDTDGFGLLTKFITIEEAIDPVFRTRPGEDGSKSIDGSETAGKLVHGYERYIEWMTRCLRAFETITVVGMDYAIADVVSLVTILQRRKIGEHEEVETFTLDQGNKRYTSGIQVKLHLCA